jgi:hypothetical protein
LSAAPPILRNDMVFILTAQINQKLGGLLEKK